ncbi:MAG: 2-amino-4-ketopentanoate thiolase [Clostridia bacterium]|nr:2-amino-4-ketopentanoate thiolase [Clostridia bacterium]
MAKKNDWVLIHRNILDPAGRAAAVPDDTRAVPLEMWVKGHLQQDAEIGEEVTVITRTGRTEHGRLLEVNPYYKHDFGEFVPELLAIDDQLRGILFGGEEK